MIAATILAIFLIFGMGGGPFGELTSKYMKDPIKETVAEEARRDIALDELKSLNKAIKDFNKNVSKDIKKFDKLVENYESTPEEFDQMVSGVFTKRKQEVETLWDRRSAMLTHIKPDEWQTIVSSAKMKAEEKAKK